MSTINKEIEQGLNDILMEKNKSILPETLKEGVSFFGIKGTVKEQEDLDDELEEQTNIITEQESLIADLMSLIKTKTDPSELGAEFDLQDIEIENQRKKIEELYQLLETKATPVVIDAEDIKDATAVEKDIIKNKVAYGQQGKIIGTIVEGEEDVSQYTSSKIESQNDSLKIIQTPNIDFAMRKDNQYNLLIDNKNIINAIGLDANKIKVGENILGIDGTYEGIVSSGVRELSQTDISNVTISNSGNWTYTFIENENGYYESNNKGKDNSFAMCRIDFNVKKETDLIFNCINYAESNYDFGIFGILDTELGANNTVDSSSKVHHSFKGMSNQALQSVTYSKIPVGEHFIYVKFRKDSSGKSGNDSLQFKLEIPETGTALVSTQIYMSKEEMMADTTKANDAYGLIYNKKIGTIDKILHCYEGQYVEMSIINALQEGEV